MEAPAPNQPRNGFGITALVLGIVGVGFGLIPILFFLAIILGVLALVFGVLGWSRATKGVATNKTMSIISSVLGVVAIALGIWGAVIVNQAAEELKDNLQQIEQQVDSLPTMTQAPGN